jgi:hypothetical protein
MTDLLQSRILVYKTKMEHRATYQTVLEQIRQVPRAEPNDGVYIKARKIWPDYDDDLEGDPHRILGVSWIRKPSGHRAFHKWRNLVNLKVKDWSYYPPCLLCGHWERPGHEMGGKLLMLSKSCEQDCDWGYEEEYVCEKCYHREGWDRGLLLTNNK